MVLCESIFLAGVTAVYGKDASRARYYVATEFKTPMTIQIQMIEYRPCIWFFNYKDFADVNIPGGNDMLVAFGICFYLNAVPGGLNQRISFGFWDFVGVLFGFRTGLHLLCHFFSKCFASDKMCLQVLGVTVIRSPLNILQRQ